MNFRAILKHLLLILILLYVFTISTLRIYNAYNEQGLPLIGWDTYHYLAFGLCFYRAPIDYVLTYSALPRIPDIINGAVEIMLPPQIAFPLISLNGILLNTILLIYIYTKIRHSKEEYDIYIVLLLTLIPIYYVDLQRFYWYLFFFYFAFYYALDRNSLKRSIVLYFLGTVLTYHEIFLIFILTTIYLIVLAVFKFSHLVSRVEKYIYNFFVIILIVYLIFFIYKHNLYNSTIFLMFAIYYVLSIGPVLLYLYLKKAYTYGIVIMLLSLPFIYVGWIHRVSHAIVLFFYMFLPYLKYKRVLISINLYKLMLFIFALAFTLLHAYLMTTPYYLNTYRHWFTSSDVSFASSLASYINDNVSTRHILFLYDYDYYGRDIIFFELVRYFSNCKFHYYIYKLDSLQTNMPQNINNITYIYIDLKSKTFTVLSQEDFLNQIKTS